MIQYTDPSNHLWQYRYDINDNLIVTKLVNPTDNSIMSMIQYTYDGSGNRVTKSIMNPGTGQPTMTTTYWSDTYETDTDPSNPGGQAARITISLTGQHLATLSIPTNEPSVTSYYHNDPLGTSQVITSQSGAILSATDTLPYGEITNQTLNLPANQAKPKDYFGLHERDTETDLIYMNARYYSSNIKRFYSLDPAALQVPERFINDPQQLNTYSYARNNPVSYNDPTGAFSKKTAQGVAAGAKKSAIKTAKQIGKFVSGAMGDTAKFGPLGPVVTGGRMIVSAASSGGQIRSDFARWKGNISGNNGDYAQGVAIGSLAVDTCTVVCTGGEGAEAEAAAGEIPTIQPTVNGPFKSYSAFKRANGPAGSGMEWHHIVEQNPTNTAQFGPEALQNGDNIIGIPVDVHRKISGTYTRGFGEYGRYRDYVSSLDYASQMEKGLKVLNEVISQ